MSSGPSPHYAALTLLFLFLSLTGVGLIGYFVPDSGLPFLTDLFPSAAPLPAPRPTSVPTVLPTPTEVEISPVATPTEILPSVVPSSATVSPTLKPSPTLKITLSPSPKATTVPSALPTPTPSIVIYKNTSDNFTVAYSSSRKLYEDTENGGVNRYTFYRSDSSFAIHIGPAWSWLHPGRKFDSNVLVAGFPSFKYESSGQTLIDLNVPNLKITLQCIHRDSASIKSECQQFTDSFTLQSGGL
jgi:hypothetical protein